MVGGAHVAKEQRARLALGPAAQTAGCFLRCVVHCAPESTVLYLSLLFLHFIGLALGVGTSFAMLTLGAATKDLPSDERTKFMLRAGALRKNGSIGLALLILSGLALFMLQGGRLQRAQVQAQRVCGLA